jgi:hypothetical protein
MRHFEASPVSDARRCSAKAACRLVRARRSAAIRRRALALSNALIELSFTGVSYHTTTPRKASSRVGIYPQFLTASTSFAGRRSPLQLIRRGASRNRSLKPSFSYRATILSVA